MLVCKLAAFPNHMRQQRQERVVFGDLTTKQRFMFLIPIYWNDRNQQ